MMKKKPGKSTFGREESYGKDTQSVVTGGGRTKMARNIAKGQDGKPADRVNKGKKGSR